MLSIEANHSSCNFCLHRIMIKYEFHIIATAVHNPDAAISSAWSP